MIKLPFNNIKKINPFKKHILALEFIEGGIKLGILEETRKQRRITDLEFFQGPPDEIKANLKDFLKRKNIHFLKVITSISRYIVSSRYVSLPASDYKEIEKMIPFQLRRLFPYGAGEVEFSFQVLDTDNEGFSRIMVFVIQNEKLDNLIKILEELKLRVEVLTVSSWGIFNWFLNQPKDLKQETVGIVEVDALSLEFCVMHKDKLVFSRASLVTDKSKIVDEISVCFNVYHKELNIAQIKNLILVGEEDLLKEIADSLSASQGFNVEIKEPWHNLPLKREKHLLDKFPQIAWTSIVGFLLEKRISSINLLPASVKQNIQEKIKTRSRNKSVVISLLLLSLISLNLTRYLYQRSYVLKEIDKKITVLSPQVEKLSDMQKKIQFVKRELKEKFLCISILKELYEITPDGVSLNIFIYEKGNEVVLKGISKQMSLVFDYVSILEKSNFLKNAQVRFATKRIIGKEEFTDFEIASTLRER